jgi:hypothetical protein
MGAAEHNTSDMAAPAAILWPDPDRQWEPLLSRIRSALPTVFTLGPYDPTTKTGPAIWLKAALGRSLPEISWPADATPVLYLPGVSRQDLRAIEDCPRALQPLAELQYRGSLFIQYNGKDWTVLAFLTSDKGGLGLDVARDQATQEAMLRSLVKLADARIEDLRVKRLEAADFNALLTPDPVRDLLTWLNDPAASTASWVAEESGAFRSTCKSGYGFDPENDGPLVGAEKLGHRSGPWEKVWTRFAEAPQLYPGIPERLRQAKPASGDLFYDRSTWPQDNEELEEALAQGLLKLKGLSFAEATKRLKALTEEHGLRRRWVWAGLGKAPLAKALTPLGVLASVAAKPLTGATPDDMAKAYTETGWQADAAVLDALACVEEDKPAQAVQAAVIALYTPWLEEAANRFGDLVQAKPLSGAIRDPDAAKPASGTCILFADGLRFDVAQKLKQAIDGKGLANVISWRWAALPPVTPTAKPAASPITHLIRGTTSTQEFRPESRTLNKELTHDRFQQMLKTEGYQVLGSSEPGDPKGVAWTEYGSLDAYGHKQGWKLAWRIAEELRGLTSRIADLLNAGWREIRVVTDHGWLLLPGGLTKIEMPKYLVDTRWGRCAIPKPGSQVEVPTVLWHWDPSVTVAVAPGIKCFKGGSEYTHGGLTLQECVVPEMVIRAAVVIEAGAKIAEVKWTQLRCRIQVQGSLPNAQVAIRTKVNVPEPKTAVPRSVSADGTVSLVVDDDSLIGSAVMVVLLDESGSVVDKFATTVGG